MNEPPASQPPGERSVVELFNKNRILPASLRRQGVAPINPAPVNPEPTILAPIQPVPIEKKMKKGKIAFTNLLSAFLPVSSKKEYNRFQGTTSNKIYQIGSAI